MLCDPQISSVFVAIGRGRHEGLCATTEAEQEDLVAGAPETHQRDIAVDEVARDAEAGSTAEAIVDAPHHRHLDVTAGEPRTASGVVIRELAVRIDGCVRPAARRPKELVNVAAEFIDLYAAGLPVAVGKDKNVAAGEGRHSVRRIVVVPTARRLSRKVRIL